MIIYYDFHFHHLILQEGETLSSADWPKDILFCIAPIKSLAKFSIELFMGFLNQQKECSNILKTGLILIICIENISSMLFILCSSVPPQGRVQLYLGQVVPCTILKGASQKDSDKNAWPTCKSLRGCLRGPWFLNRGTCS